MWGTFRGERGQRAVRGLVHAACRRTAGQSLKSSGNFPMWVHVVGAPHGSELCIAGVRVVQIPYSTYEGAASAIGARAETDLPSRAVSDDQAQNENGSSSEYHIVVDKLERRFGDFLALTGVDMHITRGAITVVIGGSGAG